MFNGTAKIKHVHWYVVVTDKADVLKLMMVRMLGMMVMMIVMVTVITEMMMITAMGMMKGEEFVPERWP